MVYRRLIRFILLGTLLSRLVLADSIGPPTEKIAMEPEGALLSSASSDALETRYSVRRSRTSAKPSRSPRSKLPGAAALDQDLETTHDELVSRRFVLRYPKDTPAELAGEVMQTLESELDRLRVWIPAAADRSPFEVHLYAEFEFQRVYGPAVTGMYYGGRVRVPIVDWGSRRGVVLSALTHELVHALITRDVGYGMPAWLHEGLAQYLEPDHRIRDVVAFPRSESMPLPLLEEILTGAGDAGLVDRAYGESVWIVHFLGNRYGISGVRRLLRSLARGADLDSALSEALGLSTLGFERAYRRWRSSEASTVVLAYGTWDGGEDNGEEGEMNEWHLGYERRVRPVKAALRSVVDALRQGNLLRLQVSCPQLRDALSALLDDPEFYDCPDSDLWTVLYEAFQHFEELALSCQLGHVEQMYGELGAAEHSLQVSAYLLASYGLEP